MFVYDVDVKVDIHEIVFNKISDAVGCFVFDLGLK